jgi:hypothetical protein
MDFEVYCDESRPDLFASQREGIGRFMIIGSVWIKAADRTAFRDELKQIHRATPHVRRNEMAIHDYPDRVRRGPRNRRVWPKKE